jgi:dipeptidyl aminopeptidase/acylaminoacyl peptidase
MTQKIPYGFWPSTISSDYLTAQSVRYSEIKLHDDKIYWLETRPNEKGRSVLVCYENEQAHEVLPSSISVRTRAQEYGGSCYCLTENAIYFINDQNQAIYQLGMNSRLIQQISPDGPYRYADLIIDQQHQRLIAVREHNKNENTHAISEIIAINLQDNSPGILITGDDFYSNPQISPCGDYLSYLSWNHPQMPWDGSCCFIADINSQGKITSKKLIAGSTTESIFHPQWSTTGQLYFVSDHNNWWNIYSWDGDNIRCIHQMDAEFATPQWVFGMSTYGFLNDHEIFCCYTQKGQWNLAIIDSETQQFITIENNFCDISCIATHNNQAAFIANTATESNQIFIYHDKKIKAITTATQYLTSDIAKAHSITFPTRDGEIAYGFYYPPTNSLYSSENNAIDNTDKKPPLIVLCHGGPTGACETGFNLKIQFWTHRGFAVIDVNYRGSTGYGRQYRDALKNNWGIKDVADVCSAAEYAITQGWVDPQKTIIRGSSAGGFTVLAALTFADSFAIGCSLYGIGDLEALAKDTHKFEAHYLDNLVGAYPQMRHIYQERSPIYHIEKLNCPVIFFQGLKDKVVPPVQAEAMVNALRQKNIDVEYVTFTEEGHGFRQADNIKILYEKELAFYQRLLHKIETAE